MIVATTKLPKNTNENTSFVAVVAFVVQIDAIRRSPMRRSPGAS
jgi:hypothetical protein